MTELKLIFVFAAKNTFQCVSSWFKCGKKSSQYSLIPQHEPPELESELQPQNTVVDDIRIPQEEQ